MVAYLLVYFLTFFVSSSFFLELCLWEHLEAHFEFAFLQRAFNDWLADHKFFHHVCSGRIFFLSSVNKFKMVKSLGCLLLCSRFSFFFFLIYPSLKDVVLLGSTWCQCLLLDSPYRGSPWIYHSNVLLSTRKYKVLSVWQGHHLSTGIKGIQNDWLILVMLTPTDILCLD